MPSINLVQLNIERDKHLDMVLPFVKAQNPDIITFQELADHSVTRLEALGYAAHFTPMNKRIDAGVPHIQGIAIFSKLPFTRTWSEQYAGAALDMPEYVGTTPESKHATQKFRLCMAEVEKDGAAFRVATTHFPWTEGGSTSDFQREDMQKLLGILEKTGEIILTGDFNAPRGGEIFSMLANKYTDNVPPQYTSSIDGSLHRAGPLPYMVDGIFTSPGYTATDVSMRSGVSDHCALIASISTS